MTIYDASYSESINTKYALIVSILFISPDPKGHVRYCHHLASISVVCKLLHYNLLL